MESWDIREWVSIGLGMAWILIGVRQLRNAPLYQEAADELRLKYGSSSRYRPWVLSQRHWGFVLIGLGIFHLLMGLW
jgi:hypothetical protein